MRRDAPPWGCGARPERAAHRPSRRLGAAHAAISDFQFLIDEDGLVQMPTPDILADATSRSVTPTGSIARRRGLARVLDAAATVAAVSEPFADIYRKAPGPGGRPVAA